MITNSDFLISGSTSPKSKVLDMMGGGGSVVANCQFGIGIV